MHDLRQRAMALSGAAFVVLAIVGNEVLGRAGQAPAVGAPAADVAKFMASRQPTFHLAVGAELIGLAALVVFFAFLAQRLRAAGADAGPSIVLVAGGSMVAVKAASAPALVVAVHAAETLPSELVANLARMNDVAFVTTWPLLGTVLLAVAVGGHRALPRAAALAAAPIGSALLLIPLAGVIEGNFLPMLLAMLWILATSLTLAIRQPTPRATTIAPVLAGA